MCIRDRQIHSAGDIGCVVHFRPSVRFRNERLSREVQDAFDGVSFKSALQILRIADIAFYEFVIPDEVAMSGGEVVEDQRFETALTQRGHGVTADVSRAPRHEDHDARTFLKYSIVSSSPRSTGNSGFQPS